MQNTNTQNNPKIVRVATIFFVAMILILGLLSVATAAIVAPSRIELAEKNYKEAAKQLEHWKAKEKEFRCDLVAVKIADHEELNLGSEEITRLSGVMAECEGK